MHLIGFKLYKTNLVLKDYIDLSDFLLKNIRTTDDFAIKFKHCQQKLNIQLSITRGNKLKHIFVSYTFKL